MLKIRKLAHNIFFKLFIGLLILSFTFFGVSNFVLNGSNTWVAKVGGKSISYAKLNKAMQSDRKAILSSNANNPKAIEYIESEKFRSDVLGHLVNQLIVEKLRDGFGIEASRKIILENIATDPQFMRNGKFDHDAFQNFLAQSGFDEVKYVKAVQDEIVGAMIVNTISLASPTDEYLVKKVVALKEEKRIADVIKISDSNVGAIAAPNSSELEEFFAKNKQKFITPETRKVSYITLAQKDLPIKIEISEQEIVAEYEKNKSDYQQPQTRDFYHVLFEQEDKARLFLEALKKSDASDEAKEFIALAKKLTKKSLKDISLKNMSEKSLLPEIGSVAFKMNKNEISSVITSPLGFHVLFVNNINSDSLIPFAKVKNDLKKKLLSEKNDEFVQKRISQIEDSLLASNSLEEAAKKFGLKTHGAIVIDQQGSAAVKDLGDFVKNAFQTSANQVSKLYYSQSSGTFYALKVESINPEHEKKLAEVKSELLKSYAQEKRLEKLRELAQKVSSEISEKPNDALNIAAKYHLKVEKNKTFPRFYYLEFQGKKVPYSSKLLEELFSAKVGQITSASAASKQEFNIAILRDIKKAPVTDAQIAMGKGELTKNYREEFMQLFNQYLQQKYPVKVNEKFLKSLEESEEQK